MSGPGIGYPTLGEVFGETLPIEVTLEGLRYRIGTYDEGTLVVTFPDCPVPSPSAYKRLFLIQTHPLWCSEVHPDQKVGQVQRMLKMIH